MRQQLGMPPALADDVITKAYADAQISVRVLRYDNGWPARPADDLLTLFIGGTAPADAPAGANLTAGDYWLPASE